MELNIKDRLYLAQILPQNNNFLDFVTKKAIIKKTAISAEEKEKFNIVENPQEGRITWDVEKDYANPLVVDFTESELDLLKRGCEARSESVCPDDFWVTVEKIYDAINASN